MQMFEINNDDDVIEAIDKMFKYFFKASYYDLELVENKLCYKYDTSFHGSPHYQYKLITDDKNKTIIFNNLVALRNSLLNKKTINN